MADVFYGFPREMPSFLLNLKVNNTLEKLQENKEMYLRNLTIPLEALHGELVPVIMEVGTDFDLSPSACISPMYTGRRFSVKYPLREYVYLRFKTYGKQKDIPGLYFDMSFEYYSYGLRIYEQTAGGMSELREKALANTKGFNDALNLLKQCGFSMKGISYKRDHYPNMPDSSVKELLNYRFFYIGKEEPLSDVIFSEDLINELKQGYLQLKELYLLITGK